MSLVKIPFLFTGLLSGYGMLTPPQPQVPTRDRHREVKPFERWFSATVRIHSIVLKVCIWRPASQFPSVLTPSILGISVRHAPGRNGCNRRRPLASPPILHSHSRHTCSRPRLPRATHYLLTRLPRDLGPRDLRGYCPLPVLLHARPLLHLRSIHPRRAHARPGRLVRRRTPPELCLRRAQPRRPWANARGPRIMVPRVRDYANARRSHRRGCICRANHLCEPVDGLALLGGRPDFAEALWARVGRVRGKGAVALDSIRLLTASASRGHGPSERRNERRRAERHSGLNIDDRSEEAGHSIVSPTVHCMIYNCCRFHHIKYNLCSALSDSSSLVPYITFFKGSVPASSRIRGQRAMVA